jgi:hypothetical protein
VRSSTHARTHVLTRTRTTHARTHTKKTRENSLCGWVGGWVGGRVSGWGWGMWLSVCVYTHKKECVCVHTHKGDPKELPVRRHRCSVLLLSRLPPRTLCGHTQTAGTDRSRGRVREAAATASTGTRSKIKNQKSKMKKTLDTHTKIHAQHLVQHGCVRTLTALHVSTRSYKEVKAQLIPS